jgi:PAS domain S-box-containing protein
MANGMDLTPTTPSSGSAQQGSKPGITDADALHTGLPPSPIANNDLIEALRQKDALYRLTDRLHRARSLDDVYDAALQAIIGGLVCDRASILLFDQKGVMRFVASQGLSASYRAAVEGHSPWSPGEMNPVPIPIPDIKSASLEPALKAVITNEGIGAAAFIPLVADGKLVGKFMAYFNGPHAFSDNELQLGLTIGRQLAFSIQRLKSDAMLRARERRFREMIDALPAAIYTTDAEGRLTHFNQAAVEFSGNVPELGTAKWCVTWKLFNADGTPLPHDECPMAISLKEGRAIRGAEAIAMRPDGTRRWFAPYPTPLHDEHGNLVAGINMLVDITERKAAENELLRKTRQLSAFLETAAIGLHRVGADGTILWANEAELQMLGYTPEEYIGHQFSSFHVDQDVAANLLGCLSSGETVRDFKARLRCKDGSTKTALIDSSVLWEDGRFIHTQCFTRDITEHERAEELRAAIEAERREADQRKDEFLAMLAHELRNPLAPIANAVHLLRREANPSPLQTQARTVIERQTAQLTRLVNDLLEVSRITTGRIQFRHEWVAIAGIVECALATVEAMIEQAGHTLVVSVPPEPIWLHADSARLEQALVNLLNNAAKYTPDGGRIELIVERRDGTVVVTVRDTGIGIEPQLLPKVFELFTQAERSLNRSHGGLGVGLWLVKTIAEMHGGSVTAASTLGSGSEFVLQLPESRDAS